MCFPADRPAPITEARSSPGRVAILASLKAHGLWNAAFPPIKCPSRSRVSIAGLGSPSRHAVDKEQCSRPIALRTGRRGGAVADLIRNDL